MCKICQHEGWKAEQVSFSIVNYSDTQSARETLQPPLSAMSFTDLPSIRVP
jgi:hypothetical protein